MSKPIVDESQQKHVLTMEDFPPLAEMSENEKLDEIATSLREVKVALAAFQNLGPAGVFKMMMGK